MTVATSILKRKQTIAEASKLYDPELAMAIVMEIAEGKLLKEVLGKEGMPSRATFYLWVQRDQALLIAYNAAVALSATALEEDAIEMAREIRKKQRDGTQVRAFEVAMNQLRWSAARRDPQRFGDRANTVVKVPIQITTSLDLGGEGVGGTLEHPNIYALEAKVGAEVKPLEQVDKPNLHPEQKPRTRHGQKIRLLPRVVEPAEPTEGSGDN